MMAKETCQITSDLIQIEKQKKEKVKCEQIKIHHELNGVFFWGIAALKEPSHNRSKKAVSHIRYP